ncbi:MAG: helix-hairpin-helix domain-containing protein [Anaerolineales bacterium]|nr:helix-hairpin-helix domain-containing protein [Anaerolineales bacterium]
MFNKWWDLLIGVLFGMLCAGLILLISKPRSGNSILLRPPPTLAPVVVNVDGAVIFPGVYSLPIHSRVMDAVDASGGFTENARPGSINLAALVEDGSHIYVPYQSAGTDTRSDSGIGTYAMSESGEMIVLININQAPVEVLITLPGIGPVTAEKIISYREEQTFTRIEEIQKVPGIGPSTYQEIEMFITVGE